MKLWIIFLVILLTPLYSFGQEEVKDEEISPTIQAILEKSLPYNPDRVIKVHPQTGTVIVRDTPSNHRRIDEILKDIDVVPQQITIEARFVELNPTEYYELGINWGDSFLWERYTSAPPQMRRADGTIITAQRDVAMRITGGQTPGQQGDLVTFPFSTSEGLSLQFARLKSIQFDLILHALAQKDKANMLSAPKITTINGQPANIQIVTTIPYVTNVERENIGGDEEIWQYKSTIQEKEEGIRLVVTPNVGEDSKIITLRLEPMVKVMVGRTTYVSNDVELSLPIIDERSLNTTVMVQSGETVVMGGLLDDRENETIQKVPILGDIPLLGLLFRHKYTHHEKMNLLIFVTASLVDPSGKKLVD